MNLYTDIIIGSYEQFVNITIIYLQLPLKTIIIAKYLLEFTLNTLNNSAYSTLWNSLVALGTLFLAVMTFLSIIFNMKTLEHSKMKLEIMRLPIIKEQLKDRLKYIINPLKYEIETEIQIIEKNDYNWIFLNNPYKILNFPIKEDKFFYTKDHNQDLIPITSLLYLDEVYGDCPKLEEYLKLRKESYHKIENSINNIKNIISSDKLEENLIKEIKNTMDTSNYLIGTHNNMDYNEVQVSIHHYIDDELEDGTPVSRPIIHTNIPFDTLVEDIKKHLIFSIFNKNITSTKIFDKIIVEETKHIREKFNELLQDYNIVYEKNKILRSLDELKEQDTVIITILNNIIGNYREHKLSNEDLTKP